jgi:hypothetical protein
MRLITILIEVACMIDKYEFIKSMDKDTKDNPNNDKLQYLVGRTMKRRSIGAGARPKIMKEEHYVTFLYLKLTDKLKVGY